METFHMFLWNVGMCVQTESALGGSWDSFSPFLFSLISFTHSVSFSSLLCFDHPLKFEFFLWCYLACNSSLIFTTSEQKCGFCRYFFFTTFHILFFFVNECNCRTSSIVHFHCLAISYVCQICGPFCQRYLMIVHVRLYGLCQRSCVKFKIENVVFCMLYHLNVYILVLQFAQHWPFDQPKFWKRPRRFSKVVEKCAWGKKVGKKLLKKNT